MTSRDGKPLLKTAPGVTSWRVLPLTLQHHSRHHHDRQAIREIILLRVDTLVDDRRKFRQLVASSRNELEMVPPTFGAVIGLRRCGSRHLPVSRRLRQITNAA